MIREGHYNPLIIKAFTMIDPITEWLKKVQYNGKQADTIANIVKKTWLCRYPFLTIIT